MNMKSVSILITRGTNTYKCDIIRINNMKFIAPCFTIKIWYEYLTFKTRLRPQAMHQSRELISSIIKGATKSDFRHYSYAVIILFNPALYNSVFSTDSFRKLVFCLSELFALRRIWCNLYKRYNICIIIVYKAGVRYSVFLF